MRIIGGTLKGRKLFSWKGPLPVRPMTDRIKETVFNVLAPYLHEGCLFLDLFSGTGSLALEALSRGAGQAHTVEKHPSCIKLIRKNAQLLPDPGKLILHRQNVFSFLNQASRPSPEETENISQTVAPPFERRSQSRPPADPSSKQKGYIGPFDIITADPPFALNAGPRLMEGLQNSYLTTKGTVIVIETGRRENLKDNDQNFRLLSQKLFNDKKIWFYIA